MKEIIRPEAVPLRTLPSAELKMCVGKTKIRMQRMVSTVPCSFKKKKLLKVRLICHWTFKKEKQTGVNNM